MNKGDENMETWQIIILIIDLIILCIDIYVLIEIFKD